MLQKQNGLTLVEILVTLSIVAIVASLAGPSFVETISKTRIKSEISQLQGALLQARSESVKVNLPVGICKTLDGTACNGANWEDGWLIYVDRNQSAAYEAANDDVIRFDIDVSKTVTIRSSNFYNVNDLFYRADGSVNGPSNEGFKVCARNSDRDALVISIEATGRPSVEESPTPCPNW